MFKRFKFFPRIQLWIVLGLLALFTVQLTHAHLFTKRWQGNIVYWYIGGGGGTVPSAWASEYRTAASTWISAPGSFGLAEVSPTSALANFGAKNFSTDPSLPNSWYGAAYTFEDSSNTYIVAASAYLNKDYTWYTDGSTFPDVQMVALHEMGHWVHFKDDCSLPESVICAQTSIRRALSADDKSDLSAAYP